MSMFNTLCLSSTAPKIIKYLSNVHEKGGALLLCMNNDYAKFKYEGMKLFELHFTQTRHHRSILTEKMSKFKTPINEKKM